MENLDNIITVGSLILSLIALFWQFIRDKADISSKLIDDIIAIKDQMEKQKNEAEKQKIEIEKKFEIAKKSISSLKCSLTTLRKRVAYLKQGVDTLVTQLIELGETPRWQPSEEDIEDIEDIEEDAKEDIEEDAKEK